MKILIADDDETSRAMLRMILSKWGYEVVSTRDGEEAFSVMQKEDAPQLALLDWMMPKMDGFSLCRKLRGQERENPLYLILLTSKTNRRDVINGLEAGADDYISKPYDSFVLQARINVGHRMILLQNKMRRREKLQGVLEMAGAVCHELNQPLQTVSGYVEILMMDMKTDSDNFETLKKLKAGVDRIGNLTNKIMNITRYQSKPYLKRKIVDIEQASTKNGKGT